MNFLKSIFGEKVNFKELIDGGATIIDVRSQMEFQQGHLKNSINIPLDKLATGLKKLNRNKAIITCCASGARSASAKRMLEANGFVSVHN